MRAPLNIIGGFYKDPNKHWSAQDTLNWYPVRSERPGTRTEWEFRDAPGVKPLCKLGINDGTFVEAGPGRGLRNVEGKLFAVAGTQLFQITNDLVSVPYGTIPGVGRVSMAHNQYANGNELLTVNGSAGYVLNTATQAFQKITDTGYPGAFIADYVDGYLAQVAPLGNYWFHSDLADALAYSMLDQYEAEGDPDRIVTLHVSHREVLLFGADTIEPYVNAPRGSGIAPFQRASNTVIQCGCSAKFSPKTIAGVVAFLDDKRVVQVLSGYSLNRISTVGIEQALGECSREEIAAAYAYTFEDRGHKIYYLTVPGRFTFGYDFLAQEWHRRASFGLADVAFIDVAFWNGMWVALDRRYGRLYQLDWDYKLDVCDPLVRERVTGVLSNNQNRVTVNELELLFNVGTEISVCQPFQEQPEGPTITGEAPDGIVGDAYTYTYTVTPGDAPIVRTIIVSGTLLPGLSWDQSTATLSGTPTTAGTMTLTIRTIDQNGLFDELVDVIPVVAYEVLLITGSDSGEGFVFARGRTFEVPTFEGLLTSTGADLASGSGGFYGSVWTVNGAEECRYSEDDMETWQTGDIPINTYTPRRIAGGASGWLASISVHAAPQPTYVKAPLVPSAYVSYTFDRVISESEEAPVGFLSMIRYTDGYYYVDQDGSLMRSVDLENNWELVGGYRPDGIVWFRDAIVFNDELYVTCQQYIDGDLEQPARYQLRRWNGSDFSTILIDNVTPTNIQPWQLEAGNGVLLVYCWGGTLVYTSANDFEEPIATGIRSATAATIQDESKGRQIVFAGGYFYLISGSGTDPALNNKVVVTTDGLTFGDPVAPPVSALISISSSAEPE